jgi:siroheme synthase
LLSPLALLPGAAQAAKFSGPVLFIIGRVASLAAELSKRDDETAAMEMAVVA